jgi:hypothetical protein
MRNIRWKFALPILQLIIAICVWLYIPFQFDREMRGRMGILPEQTPGRILGLSAQAFDFYFPPLAGRVLYAINFPAYEISNELQRFDLLRSAPNLRFTIEDKQTELPVRYILGIRELTFFAGVFLLWLWVGFEIDVFQQKGRHKGRPRASALQFVQPVIIFAVGTLLTIRSVRCLEHPNCAVPQRIIVAVGLIWPAISFMVVYFRLKHAIVRRRTSLSSNSA